MPVGQLRDKRTEYVEAWLLIGFYKDEEMLVNKKKATMATKFGTLALKL